VGLPFSITFVNWKTGKYGKTLFDESSRYE
jgi:hypothetical protein